MSNDNENSTWTLRTNEPVGFIIQFKNWQKVWIIANEITCFYNGISIMFASSVYKQYNLSTQNSFIIDEILQIQVVEFINDDFKYSIIYDMNESCIDNVTCQQIATNQKIENNAQ